MLGGSGCFHSNLGFVGGQKWHRWGTSAVTRRCVCVELGETSTSGRGGLPEVPRPQDESWRCVLTKRSLTTLRSRTVPLRQRSSLARLACGHTCERRPRWRGWWRITVDRLIVSQSKKYVSVMRLPTEGAIVMSTQGGSVASELCWGAIGSVSRFR